MTLILTALSPRFIVMVSDRRVTRGAHPLAGMFVKAVVTPRFVCSYTGVAKLGADRDTARWIAKTIVTHDQDDDGGLEHLRAAVAEKFRSPRYARYPHAIVCMTWQQAVGPIIATPRLFVVSNYGFVLDRRPTLVPFNIQTLATGPRRLSTVFPIGAAICEEEYHAVNRSVERLCVSKRDTVRAIAEILTESIRGVSRTPKRRCASCPLLPDGCRDNSTSTVSEDVLVVGVPRPGLLSDLTIVGRQVDDRISVTGIRAGPGRLQEQGGPIIVGIGDGVIRPLEPHEMTFGSPEGDKSGLELLVVPSGGEGSFASGLMVDPKTGIASIPMWHFPRAAGM